MSRRAHPTTSLACALVAALGFACALAACSTVHSVGKGIGLSNSSELSFAQVQTIQTGLTSAQIRDAFGQPMNLSRDAAGRVTRMEYVAYDAKQSRSRLILDFDGADRLVTKRYTGEILRP